MDPSQEPSEVTWHSPSSKRSGLDTGWRLPLLSGQPFACRAQCAASPPRIPCVSFHAAASMMALVTVPAPALGPDDYRSSSACAWVRPWRCTLVAVLLAASAPRFRPARSSCTASAFVPGCSAGHLSFKQPANNLGCTHQSKNRHAGDVQVRSQGRAVLLVCTSFHGISFIPHAGHERGLSGGLPITARNAKRVFLDFSGICYCA